MSAFDIIPEKSAETNRWIAVTVSIIAVCYSLFHLWLAGVGILSAEAARHINVMGSMALIFLIYPVSGKVSRTWNIYLSIALISLAILVGVYLELQFESLFSRYGQPNITDKVLGVILIALCFEAARRVIGMPIVLVVGGFVAYAVLGNNIPGYWGHRGHGLDSIVTTFYLSDGGIYGTPIGVVVEFVVLFILFGAFLQKTGAGAFFVDLAQIVTGRMRGGSAKSSVISSALMGSITGSPTANVVTTGSITIPMMKREGYPAHVAGATEVASSVGGVILPPVMGSAAFLIVAMTGISYGEIVKAATLPALLYFISVYANVHFYACRIGLTPSRGALNDYWSQLGAVLLKGWPYIGSIALLIYLLVTGWSATISAFYSIGALIAFSSLSERSRLSSRDIIDALEMGARNALPVAAACLAVGMIIGSVELTGVGIKFTSLMTSGTGGNLFWAIVLVGLASLVLGIEMPISAAYLIVAILAAPALVELGVPILVAHLICLWFALDSAVTPPVCITSYVAAGVAKAHPFKTGISAWKMAKGLYIIPFLMAYSPLTMNGTFYEVTLAFGTGTLGLICLAAAWEGYLITRAKWIERAALVIVVVLAVYPGEVTDYIAAAVFVAILAMQVVRQKGERTESTVSFKTGGST